MNLLLYAPSNDTADRLLHALTRLHSQMELELFRNIPEFQERLQQSMYNAPITVILTTNREELLDILSIKDLLRDVRNIIILPDDKNVTAAMGFALYPRFVSYADSDFTDVVTVLNRITNSI